MKAMNGAKEEPYKMTPKQAEKTLEFLRKAEKAYTDYNVPAGADAARRQMARVEKEMQK